MQQLPLPASTDSKATWRRWAKATRATLDLCALSHTINQTISKHFTDHLNNTPVNAMLFYAALDGEVDVMPLVATLPQVTFYLPRMVDTKHLAFHRYQPGDTLIKHPNWRVKEPQDTQPCWTPENHSHTHVLVPALAVDAQSHRLGYGQGYYDRWLAQQDRSQLSVMGLCPNALHVNSLPHDSWDQRLDGVITEKGITKTG